MTPQVPLPLITVKGTPAECGAAYGRAAADLITGNLQAYRRRFAVRAGLDETAVRRAGAGFRRTTVACRPRIGEMLDAVAEGAGVPVEEIYALNARTELLYGAAPCECTSVGVLDRYTQSGHTVLGQNWDWHPAQRPYTLLLATRDEHGFAVVTLAEAGMLAKAGLNTAGVGVCVNMLGCDRDGQPGGLPYHVLLRAVLESDSLTAGLRALCTSERSASINLLLGQAYPEWGGGEIVDVELVPGDLGVLHPVDGVLAHANHLETPLPVRDTLKDLGGSSYFRAARARRLVGLIAAERKVTFDDLGRVFTDHASYPHSICRHVDLRDADEERSESIHSVLLDLDERRLAVASGPPCRSQYVWLALDELF
jgi:isopenicillin-N N-acyltransferase-like protein